MKFIDRSFEVNELGYIEVTLSYEDYSKIADKISLSKIITSTRNTSCLDTIDSELKFVIPNWVYKVRDDIAKTLDPLTNESNAYLKELTGDELIRELSCIDRSVGLWVDILQECERGYKTLVYQDDLSSLEVKNLLPLCYSIYFTLHIGLEYFMESIWKPLLT